MTEPTKRLTISISVPAAVHLGIGAVLTAAAIAAAIVGNALTAGVLSGATMAYGLWCSIQRSRNETADLHETVTNLAAAANQRHADMIAALGEVSSTLTTIAGEVADNAGRLKELSDAMDEGSGRIDGLKAALDANANAIAKATKAVNLLQDCYLKEGRLLLFPEPSKSGVPHDVDPVLSK